MNQASEALLQLNLTEIVEARAGKRGKWIPRFLLRGLERIVRQDELNEMLRAAHPLEGSAFSRRILEHLGIEVEVSGLDGLDGEFVFASNHPLGGLDGIALVAVLGEKYGDDRIRVLVNDLLMNVTPLGEVFLPTNKYGSKGARESARLLAESMEAGRSLVMFPAGLVSRLHPDGSIRDLPWKKTFVNKALEYGRRIVPVKFDGLNSMKFYHMAKLRKKLGVKVNLEQALLPSELCKAGGSRFSIRFGKPVDPRELLTRGMTPGAIADEVYRLVYGL